MEKAKFITTLNGESQYNDIIITEYTNVQICYDFNNISHTKNASVKVGSYISSPADNTPDDDDYYQEYSNFKMFVFSFEQNIAYVWYGIPRDDLQNTCCYICSAVCMQSIYDNMPFNIVSPLTCPVRMVQSNNTSYYYTCYDATYLSNYLKYSQIRHIELSNYNDELEDDSGE